MAIDAALIFYIKSKSKRFNSFLKMGKKGRIKDKYSKSNKIKRIKRTGANYRFKNVHSFCGKKEIF